MALWDMSTIPWEIRKRGSDSSWPGIMCWLSEWIMWDMNFIIVCLDIYKIILSRQYLNKDFFCVLSFFYFYLLGHLQSYNRSPFRENLADYQMGSFLCNIEINFASDSLDEMDFSPSNKLASWFFLLWSGPFQLIDSCSTTMREQRAIE